MKILWIMMIDSVRMLRAQKLFWIVLLLSGLVAFVYSSIGFHENGVSMMFGLWKFENELVRAGDEQARIFYLLIFTDIIVPYWLSLIAIILALISCASIFPEFVKRGSVDLVLSKPPSRLVLFLSKYLGSLAFVFVQVLLFCVIVFLAFGFRFGEWNVTIFWALPLVVFIFSLIYSVHVLVSVWSGSVVFGLLAAFFVWGLGVLSEWAEDWTYKFVYMIPQLGLELDMASGGPPQMGEPKDNLGEGAVTFYRIVNGLRTPMPKTRVAGAQLSRLVKVGGEDDDLTGRDLGGLMFSMQSEERETEVLERYQRRHPIWRDVVSSLGFELVCVGFAALVFCRRDY